MPQGNKECRDVDDTYQSQQDEMGLMIDDLSRERASIEKRI